MLKTEVRVSKAAFTNKEDAVRCTGGFKEGYAASDMSLTIQEIAERWIAGHTILPTKMKHGSKSNDTHWLGQQVFAVDFDNENGDKERVHDDYYVSPDEALEMARDAGLFPAFIYSSLSSTPEHCKFRMIFVLNEEVTTEKVHGEVIQRLHSAFIKGGYIIADTRCSDRSRIYYGGKEMLYDDFTAVTMLIHVKRLSVVDAPSISKLRSKHDHEGTRLKDFIPASLMHSTNVLGETTPAMTALINGDAYKLREILQIGVYSTNNIQQKNTCTVHTNINPYRTIKQYPLHSILAIPLNTAFRCIMHGHEDIHPSAIVQQLKDGSYAYFCHKCYGQGKGQTLIDLIMEATDCGVGETIAFAEIALGITLQTQHQLQCRRSCDHILRFIQSTAFRTGKWEPLYSYMKRKRLLGHYRYYVEQAALYATPDSLIGDGIPVFYEAVRETSIRMHDFAYFDCTGIDKNSVARKRNELANLGLMGKSTNLEHTAFAKATEYQRNSGNQFHKEFLFIPELATGLLEFATQQIGQVKNVGERAKFRTKASVLTARGEEAANRIFAQSAGQDLSKYKSDFISYMRRTTSRLCSKGWTDELEIIREIQQASKYTCVKSMVGQFRPLLTNGDNFMLKVVNKELRTQLKLPDNIPSRKQIIVPVDRNIMTNYLMMHLDTSYYDQMDTPLHLSKRASIRNLSKGYLTD
jgi:hypothetical protein